MAGSRLRLNDCPDTSSLPVCALPRGRNLACSVCWQDGTMSLCSRMWPFRRQRVLPDRGRGGPQDAEERGPPKATVGMVFRIRGVPRDWGIDKLRAFLVQQEGFQPRGGFAGPVVRSLADDIGGDLRVATVTVQSISLSPLPLPRPLTVDRQLHLTLDKDFHGITTLYCPSLEDHKLE